MIPKIIAGFISDEARAALATHNVPITHCEGLEVVTLDRMIGGINSSANPLFFVIGFWASDNEVEEDSLTLHLNPDAGETKLIARPGYWSTFMDEERPVL
jgi:hypothetical protein